MVGSIYGSLADRGDKTWSKVRSASLRPGTVVDATADQPSTPAKAATAAKVTSKESAAAGQEARGQVGRHHYGRPAALTQRRPRPRPPARLAPR